MITKDELFTDYYARWIEVYKKGGVRDVTLAKYYMAHSWLKRLIPNLKVSDLNRIEYQRLLNGYAETHEKQTVMDFHHLVKGAILDAVDEGFIERIRRGYYHWIENCEAKEIVIINSLFPDAVLCMETALFYYQHSSSIQQSE